MNIAILGATGFIGRNLSRKLYDENNHLLLTGRNPRVLSELKQTYPRANVKAFSCEPNTTSHCLGELLNDRDVLYYLVGHNVPADSNKNIFNEITVSVGSAMRLLEYCAMCKTTKTKIVFISSGGAVYGSPPHHHRAHPLNEKSPANPITSYGLQKLAVEKLLYLYNYVYGLEYRILRLSNPYGPYQLPNNRQGVVANFVYKALIGDAVSVFGNGTAMRDFIYIDDAIDAIVNAQDDCAKNKLYNVGTGKGTSLQELLTAISRVLNVRLKIKYFPERKIDVPINYLDVGRYQNEFGELVHTSLDEGIRKTAQFIKRHCL